MTIRSKFRFLILLLALGALAACAVETTEESTPAGMTRQSLEDLDEQGTWELYQWYFEQGLTPCDPPPDPWHPFARHGFCPVGDVEHEVVPNKSYDE